MPSTASYRSSLRATFCATPCFPAHARVERAVPASCSTMCSDGLVVFLTCVLCCTKIFCVQGGGFTRSFDLCHTVHKVHVSTHVRRRRRHLTLPCDKVAALVHKA